MKLYKISSPGSSPVLMELEMEEGPLTNIVLGESGRGRQEEVIPITGEGPSVLAKRVGERIVLVRGDWSADDRCLAIVNAEGAYQKGRHYSILDASGVESLVTGHHAAGIAGRAGGGEESLIMVQPGGEFRLDTKYHASTWYRWTGSVWITETGPERAARLALEAVESGEGEWL